VAAVRRKAWVRGPFTVHCSPFTLFLLGALLDCGRDHRIPLTVYSPHGRDQLILIEHAFESQHPDIDVRWLDLGSQEILERLRFEKVNPQADVWFGGPTTIFQRGAADSLLADYRPSWASSVPNTGGDQYFPVYRTPAIIAYNSGRCRPARHQRTGTMCWRRAGTTGC
jgi:iron(III) transport system substrate-binding protein